MACIQYGTGLLHRHSINVGLLTAPATLQTRLGYYGVANFTRAVKRWTGFTPGQFRKK